ncbi:MAG TPA: hypothetical protein VF614_01050 [Chthoniobacteraceae bacterium]|jgi:hypothetical protein
MKPLLQIVALVLCALPLVVVAQPASEEEFLRAIRTAFEAKNVEALAALTYTEGMSKFDEEQVAKGRSRMITQEQIEDVSLEPLPSGFRPFQISRGLKVEPTYPPTGMVKIGFKVEGGRKAASSAPYAIVDGNYFLVGAKSTDLGWSGPPDKQLSFAVSGKGADKARIRVKWNSSGVDQEANSATPSSTFTGQYIQEVSVASESNDTDITLKVSEGGAEVFKSERLKGKGTVKYERKAP